MENAKNYDNLKHLQFVTHRKLKRIDHWAL